jgi:murein DD-endopeptidase MepM/ murein hydrolase activator NlpD
MKGVITARALNVRQGPSTQYSVVGQLLRDSIVSWDVSDGRWLQIGREEWIHGDFVQITEQDPIEPTPEGQLLQRPVIARISQLFGDRYAYYFKTFGIPGHNGVDYAAPEGTPISCVADGKVRTTGNDPTGYGRWVEIYHPQPTLYSFYAHFNRIDVVEGQVLEAGDRVGLMGNTGNSTGPHLHFEIRLADWNRTPEHMFFPYYAMPLHAGHKRGRVNPETIYATLDRYPVQSGPILGEEVPEHIITPEMIEEDVKELRSLIDESLAEGEMNWEDHVWPYPGVKTPHPPSRPPAERVSG